MKQYSEQIFPVNIHTFNIDNTKDLNTDLLENIYTIQDNEENYKRSNKGGFHSFPDLEKRNIKCFDALSDEIIKLTNNIIIKEDYRFEETCKKISGMWFIINKINHYNTMHTHARAFLSGAYYVKLPKKEKSYITFCDPIFVRKHENLGFTHYKKEVAESMLVLFPGWLSHEVPVNNTDEERIVISFNLGYPT